MNKRQVYLDYAAASPLSDTALKAMQSYWQDQFYNPSALYLAAKDVKKSVNSARSTVAQCLGARPSEVILTAGGTEANNLAIHGIMRRYKDKKVLISAVEHDSVREVAKLYNCQELAVDSKGKLFIDKISKKIDDDVVLVSVMLANNEIGTVQPISEIAQILSEIKRDRKRRGVKTPLVFHTDACQAANYLDLHVNRLGVDLMTLNGGKIYGPKQSGCLYVRAGLELEPLQYGGGQEQGLRSGTENVAAISGFAAALKEAQSLKKDESYRLEKLQDYFIDKLLSMPGININGPLNKRLPNNVHITVKGADNERLLMELDEQGIQCATGSACSASKEESSHVLLAVGLSDDQARSSLRFTMGRATTKSDIDYLIHCLEKLVSL